MQWHADLDQWSSLKNMLVRSVTMHGWGTKATRVLWSQYLRANVSYPGVGSTAKVISSKMMRARSGHKPMTGEIYDGARVGVQRQGQHLDQHWHVCWVLHDKIRNLEGKQKQQHFFTRLHASSFPQPPGLTFCQSFWLDELRTASCSGTLQPCISQFGTICSEFHTNKHILSPIFVLPNLSHLSCCCFACKLFCCCFPKLFHWGKGWGGGEGGGLLLLLCTTVTLSWSYQYS